MIKKLNLIIFSLLLDAFKLAFVRLLWKCKVILLLTITYCDKNIKNTLQFIVGLNLEVQEYISTNKTHKRISANFFINPNFIFAYSPTYAVFFVSTGNENFIYTRPLILEMVSSLFILHAIVAIIASTVLIVIFWFITRNRYPGDELDIITEVLFIIRNILVGLIFLWFGCLSLLYLFCNEFFGFPADIVLKIFIGFFWWLFQLSLLVLIAKNLYIAQMMIGEFNDATSNTCVRLALHLIKSMSYGLFYIILSLEHVVASPNSYAMDFYILQIIIILYYIGYIWYYFKKFIIIEISIYNKQPRETPLAMYIFSTRWWNLSCIFLTLFIYFGYILGPT
jgi:hypothetical protein